MKDLITRIVNFSKKSETFLVLYVASIISILAAIYFFSTNQILLYNDARSHMDIARRVTDSLTPGVMQIGSVWLPLYHIAMLPFVQNDWLWRTGLAGTIVSGVSYVIAALFIFKTLKLVTKSTVVTIFGFLLFCLNPNLLYLQSVPLDEVLALTTCAASIYFILKWSKTDYIPNLILAAFFAFLGSLTRYEVWFLLFAEAVFVFISAFSTSSSDKLKKAEGTGILFIFLAFFGIVLWLTYNFLGWNDPLYFLHNETAHIAQQHAFEVNGLLPTKHNLPFSIMVLLSNIVENIGIALTVAVGLSLALLLGIKDKIQNKVFYLVGFAPLGFLLLSLYFGITVLFTKFFPSPENAEKVFNVRYGVIALVPAVIIVCSALSLILKKIRLPQVTYFLMFLIVAFDIFFFLKTGIPATIQDGRTGISGFGQGNEVAMSKTVKDNCQNGLTLISAGQDEIIMFESGFPMKQFVYEGSGAYWHRALENPATLVECIVLQKNGAVDRGLTQNDSNWQRNYKTIFNAENNTFIYKLMDTQEAVAQDLKVEATVSATLHENKMYSAKAKSGDSLVKLYRQIVQNYSEESSLKLTQSQKLFMENYLVLNLPQFSIKKGDDFSVASNELSIAFEQSKKTN